ncbi:D-glycero-beta-D-manno-heptose-7-phosphate kinase [Allorhodopirellula solitaria]|uniref:Bifunctional protein HldE n=1 Tax=Allorhodopirellula solitaria TaxID=2527987 RepID=A0A5C5WMS5_9BACT|nr:D-glycero-beta-D-manno-heptose-7-phosphate kinase [Allorhodopirellula solitaria]TWT52136.1 Bifunctional protein HldE [Allorhodopirellula solitaria]
MNETTLEKLSRASEVKILCIGDVMLDCFQHGEAKRISPEAPVPVFLRGRAEQMLGGAANVARNMRAYGARVCLHGVVGDDVEADAVSKLADESELEHQMVRDGGRPTTTKIRFVSQGQQLLRSDQESKVPIDAALEQSLLQKCLETLGQSNVLVLSDYAKGCLTPDLISAAIASANSSGVPVMIDPKGKDISRYRGAWVITPNESEFHILSGNEEFELEKMAESARYLMQMHEIANIMITLGSRGILLVTPTETYSFPTVARQVYDVSGAGDSVVAALAVSLACGLSMQQSCYVANMAGGIAVEKSGTAVVSLDDLAARLLNSEVSELVSANV